jgi:uncharacterized membrane protein YbhN (UPF0104 family)
VAIAAEESAAKGPSRAGKIIRTIVGLAAGLACAGGIAWWQGTKANVVVADVLHAPPWVFLFCTASGFVVFAFQSLRWHSVMKPLLGLRYSQSYRAQVIGFMFNAIIPARGGDLLRVQYLGRRTGKSRATILGTEVVDRWLDFWGWFPVLFGLALTGHVPYWLWHALGAFGAILVAWGGMMVLLSRRGYEPKPGSRFGTVYKAFRVGVQAFRSKRMLLLVLFVAPLPWLWETIAIKISARAFDIDLTFTMAFSVLIAFNMGMVVPSPGAVGSIEAAGCAALAYFNIDQSKAFAFMVVYHFTQLLPGIVAGAVILAAEREKMFGGAATQIEAPENAEPSRAP